MIHRNAILALRTDVNRGCSVIVELSTDTALLVDDIIGVIEESHVVVEADGNRVLLSLDHITAVSVTEPLESDGGLETLAN